LIALGAAITRRAGVGRLARPWLDDQVGHDVLELSERVKRRSDPRYIFGSFPRKAPQDYCCTAWIPESPMVRECSQFGALRSPPRRHSRLKPAGFPWAWTTGRYALTFLFVRLSAGLGPGGRHVLASSDRVVDRAG